jgi:hypothetical protein
MGLDLVVEMLVKTLRAQITQKPSHVSQSLITRAIPSIARLTRSISRLNCFRPAAVIV